MTLHLHRAERADLLADGLAGLLATPLPDPFAEEVVVVPARGVERWLTQRLSHRLGVGPAGGDGVCAGVRFVSPRSLVAMLTGRERDDPWDPDRLVWPLLEVIDASVGEPWCVALAAHLGHGLDGEEAELRRNRRWSVARRLAGLFASYAVQRPRLVTDWLAGGEGDGAGGTLDHDLAWQPELWRRVAAVVPAPTPDVRHEAAVQALRGDADLDLPGRLSMFGHTRLPVTELELLDALAVRRDVHLWLPQPSAALWRTLAPAVATGPVPRVHDDAAELVDHPLLLSLGRDTRELQRSLAPLPVEDHPLPPVAPADGLLGWLQADLRADTAAGPELRATRLPDPGDRSVQVHACHGTARQVDVLREVLVGMLADDPTLEPRDILVMCPDIDTYAPLFQAGFGLGDVVEGHPAHRLRVRLADRGLTHTNPLLAVAHQVVEMAGRRVTATEVLDLAAAEPVRHRFGFTDDDLAQLAAWVDQAGVRWGLDADHRATYQLESFGQNTWRAGVDRVLLGVAMAEDERRWLGNTLPVDDVASGDVDLAGRVGELVDRLDTLVRGMLESRPLAAWVRSLREGVAGLASVPRDEQWQAAQFERELAGLEDAAHDEGAPLRLADVRGLLEHRLGGRPTRANFRTGTLTVCTMVPMRSVPHRVVCLVGLDDGVFPRTVGIDGDDVLARSPLTGERDPRSEDRQLLLDAVLAATESLVVTYTGANEHTGRPRPPAVPLGELLDTLDRTAATAVTDRVLVRHPLQPFDVRNLTPEALGTPDSFSFDRAALDGARAAAGPRHRPAPFLPGPLPPAPSGDLALADLHAFLVHPVRAFLRQRLDIAAPREADETRDAIPITLDNLERWQVGDRLLADLLALPHADLDTVAALCTAERLRGGLPPAALGDRVLHDVVSTTQSLYTPTQQLRVGEPRTLDIGIDLGDGRRLTGTVGDVWGGRLVRSSWSTLAAKHRIGAWLDLLAVTVAHPDEHWTSHAIGRHRAGAQRALAGPVDHQALDVLRSLVDLYDRGMREPLPMPLRASCAYAEGVLVRNTDPVHAARRAWETDDRPGAFPGEHDDPAHARVFGPRSTIDALTQPARDDERWNDEETRLGQLALRLWTPLLTGAEKVGPL